MSASHEANCAASASTANVTPSSPRSAVASMCRLSSRLPHPSLPPRPATPYPAAATPLACKAGEATTKPHEARWLVSPDDTLG